MAHEPTVCCGWATTDILHLPLTQWVNYNYGINKRNLCFPWPNGLNYGTTLKLLTNHRAARPVTMFVHGRSTLDQVETPDMATLERHGAQVDGCQGCSLSFIKAWKNLVKVRMPSHQGHTGDTSSAETANIGVEDVVVDKIVQFIWLVMRQWESFGG